MLTLTNNTGNILPVQLFRTVNPQDISNQPKTYTWNLTGVFISNQVSIQYRPKGSLGPFTTVTADVFGGAVAGVITALTGLNLGSFWASGPAIISAASQTNDFGNITIGTSLAFTINASATIVTHITMLFSGAITGTINWGDGNTTPIVGSAVFSHTYTVAGVYIATVILSNATLLTKIDAHTAEVSAINNLSEVPGIQVLNLQNNQLTTIDISGNPIIAGIDLDNNFLPTSVINATLIALDGFGLFPGLYNSVGQTPAAPPSGAGAAAKISLQGKGWGVNTD